MLSASCNPAPRNYCRRCWTTGCYRPGKIHRRHRRRRHRHRRRRHRHRRRRRRHRRRPSDRDADRCGDATAARSSVRR